MCADRLYCKQVLSSISVTIDYPFNHINKRLGLEFSVERTTVFDRTLKSLRFNNREAISVGVAFEDQRVAEVPRDTHDQRLDFVVTEIRARQFSTGFDV